jgi:3'(2'), 5'-bisphosphate nucleotidase|tara:strand:- start:2217 stop:3056 length:840 start_codon:yes stop_codon:yes gene_type:complete
MKNKPPFSNILPETNLAIEAAMKAGKAVIEVYKNNFSYQVKDDNSPITEADIKSNGIIQEALSITNIPILSEENVDDLVRLKHEKIWIVDPLDGTSDFVEKTGEFTIMISLVQSSKPILGVIYWPTEDKLYVAQKNKGAYELFSGHWKKLNVNNISNLEKCHAVISRHHLSESDKKFIKKLNLLEFNQKGSSLKVLDICSGEAEVYLTTTNKIKQWDTCASHCLISESGGKITSMYGEDLEFNTELINHENGLLVTNGLIHNKIVKKYSEFLNSQSQSE